MRSAYPVALRIEGKRCLVVGGGQVATKRVEGLLDASARVVVVSPAVSEEIQRWTDAKRFEWVPREFQECDLAGAMMVIAATDSASVNHAVCAAADRRGLLFNNAMNQVDCNFHVPSVLRRGNLVISVTTAGRCPALARYLRERLANMITPGYGYLLEMLGSRRVEMNQRFPDAEVRAQLLRKVMETEAVSLIEQGDSAAAEEAIESCMSSP